MPCSPRARASSPWRPSRGSTSTRPPSAALILAQPLAPGGDLTPLLAAFVNRQGGADVLAARLGQHPPPADAARLATPDRLRDGTRRARTRGRASPAAGLSTESKPLSPAELNALVALVAAHGDPARGERIFRRADLNCMSCHSISKAGGEVGPDLSALGQTSPPDYIINSILNPDQSIKEQYHTLVVQTSDGQVFQGIVTDKDEERIVLKEATGLPQSCRRPRSKTRNRAARSCPRDWRT